MEKIDDNSWLPLILVAFASFIITLDSTFMNVSISQLIMDLSTNLSTIQLIISFYTLTTASLMLVGAKLQDIIGKKKIFLLGALTYGIGALIASVSQNSLMLFIGWSLLEGIGGALMTPATISIISGTYKGDKRTTALAIVSAMAGIAAAIGPIFGGVVTTFLSWRYGFVFELAIIVFIFIFSSKIYDFESIETMDNFDITGSILLIIGLVTFILGLLHLKSNLNESIYLIIISFVILAIFTIYEYRKDKALVDVNLLRDHNLVTGTIIRLLIMVAMTGTLFAISIFLQNVLAYNAFETGFNLIPTTGGILIAAIIAPRLSKLLNHKILMIIGFILALISMFMLKTQFNLETTFSTIAPGMLVLGLGLGFIIALGIDISIKDIKEEKQSMASGILTTSQTLGNSIGTAIIGCILIIGALHGVNYAIDTYAPDMDAQELEIGSGVYLEKLGHINYTDLNEHQVKKQIVDTTLTSSMKGVMDATTVILIIGLLLTLTLRTKKKTQR